MVVYSRNVVGQGRHKGTLARRRRSAAGATLDANPRVEGETLEVNRGTSKEDAILWEQEYALSETF